MNTMTLALNLLSKTSGAAGKDSVGHKVADYARLDDTVGENPAYLVRLGPRYEEDGTENGRGSAYQNVQ